MRDGQITAQDVGIAYRLYREKVSTLKEAVANRFRHLRGAETFWALRHVSLEVAPGEALALVGHNGSGKSTLLKTIAGVLQPSEGALATQGRLSPMIELGAGFDPELSGHDNVFLNGALLGFTRKQMESKFDRIVAFAFLFVSHSFEAARELCPRAAVLHHGRLAFDGAVDGAWARYRELARGPVPGPAIEA
ncbi:MAG: ABC transporter ATP-binding protein [Deltaproteobacteria bacterium]|nr:MAG: ABC transporter ATP-binding protein [Deltaproteobacteria bacterium]